MLQVEGIAWAKVLRWDGSTESKPCVLNAVKACKSGPCRKRFESEGPHLQNSRAKEGTDTQRAERMQSGWLG